MLEQYAIPDPRNLQMEDRGIIEAVFTPEVQAAIAPFLNPIVDAIRSGMTVSAEDLLAQASGDELLTLLSAIVGAGSSIYSEVSNSLDPQMVSVFTVPMVDASQSLWHATIDLSDVADGPHTIDANAFDSNGVQIDNRPVYGKKFYLDRTVPSVDITVENGANSAMYTREDGVLIATALVTPDPAASASLILNPSATGSLNDVTHVIPQIIKHSDDMAMQMANIWTNIPSGAAPRLEGLTGEDFAFFLQHVYNSLGMLTLNAPGGSSQLAPFEMMIRGANNEPKLIEGEYGLRAVARDNLYNLSSDSAPVRVNIVAPDPDQAMIANIEIGDCNKDGDLEDPYESGRPGRKQYHLRQHAERQVEHQH